MGFLRFGMRTSSVVSVLLVGALLCGAASGAWVELTGDPVAIDRKSVV